MFEEIGILHEIGMVNNKDGKHLHAVVSSRLSGNDICLVGVYTSGFKTTTSGKNISETQTAITGCRVQYLTWAQISTCSFLCTFGVFVFLSVFFNWFTQLFTLWIIPNPFTRVLASALYPSASICELKVRPSSFLTVTLVLLPSHRAAPFFRHKNIRPSGWTFLLNRKQKGKCLGMRYLHLFAGDNWDSCTLYALAPAHIPWKSYIALSKLPWNML